MYLKNFFQSFFFNDKEFKLFNLLTSEQIFFSVLTLNSKDGGGHRKTMYEFPGHF